MDVCVWKRNAFFLSTSCNINSCEEDKFSFLPNIHLNQRKIQAILLWAVRLVEEGCQVARLQTSSVLINHHNKEVQRPPTMKVWSVGKDCWPCLHIDQRAPHSSKIFDYAPWSSIRRKVMIVYKLRCSRNFIYFCWKSFWLQPSLPSSGRKVILSIIEFDLPRAV